jgi:opacity protein-like surface antigen
MLLAAAMAALLSASATAADAVKGEWTGFITDTHCGRHGANADHTAACVAKCVKGGSKAQIRSDTDGKIYDLATFDAKVRPLVGKRVTLTGSMDPDTRVITVSDARLAAEKK